MGKRKIADLDQPWVDNYPALKEWLNKHKAFCQWQLPMGDKDAPQAYVECWQIGNRQVIVLVHAKQGGWNIFTDTNDNRIDATLADATKRLGL